MAVIIITHDLGVIARLSDRVLVMYAGRTVEEGEVDEIFHNPLHPYTQGLLKSLPRLDETCDYLPSISGSPPDLTMLPVGCAFAPRCQHRLAVCTKDLTIPLKKLGSHRAECHWSCQR